MSISDGLSTPEYTSRFSLPDISDHIAYTWLGAKDINKQYICSI